MEQRAEQRVTSILRLPVPDAGALPPAAPSVDLPELLARAAADVRDEWERAVGDGLGAEDLSTYLAALCDAVARATAGDEVTLRPIPPTIPARRMLDLLRAALLEALASEGEAPEPNELVAMMRGMERVRARIEADAAQHFASRLAGPDGLELVVEVAHDLRSPITSILFLAETLHNAQSGPINPVQERQLGLIYSAAFGLSQMANDVIELARGGDRLVDLDPIPFSVSDIMQSARDIVHPIAEEKGLSVRLTMPTGDVRVGHPMALSRVLLNLMTNALKFTDDGYVEVTAAQRSKTKLEFSVRDTGNGLPAEVLASLFEPFQKRYRPGQYTFSSSGLGLSICRKLVSAMGGELQVESAPETGTRFYFTLELPLAARM